MEGFLQQVINQEPKQTQINKQKSQPVPQQRQAVPIEFFIPPPINYMNSKYHQHFVDSQNPLKNLSATYKIFREELPFNTNDGSTMFQNQSLESLKHKLSCSNREVYMTMLRILAKQASGAAMNLTEIHNLKFSLEQKVWAFKELCIKVKVFETRNQILKKMTSQTVEINKKTGEIRTELQQIKSEFKQLSTENNIMQQFPPWQNAMQVQL